MDSKDYNSISISSIESGSVIVNGNINTAALSNSDQAKQQYNKLSQSLSTGGTIAGMQIQSSSVSVNGGTVDEPAEGVSLYLILGIFVPLTIICTLLYNLVIALVSIIALKRTSKIPIIDYQSTSIRENFELQDIPVDKQISV